MANEARALLCAAVLTTAAGCLDPTQVTLALSSDACERISETAISVGAVGEVEMLAPSATASGCSGADIGTLAVAPSDEKNAAWSLKVVSSIGALVDVCQPPEYGPECIVARRSLRFIEHTSVDLPIVMRESCLGVLCPDDQTCVDGDCRLADCPDPANCDEDALMPLDGFAWVKALGSPDDDTLFDLHGVPGGDVVVTGSAAGALDFGGEALDAFGATDIFVARLGPDGAHRWSRMFGGSGIDAGVSTAAGPTGRIHLTGNFSGNADLGGAALVATGDADVFVATYGGLGSHSWSVSFGGSGQDAGTDVAGDAAGNVYLVGTFTDAITIGDFALSGVGVEGFVASLDPTGKPRWAQSLGGMGEDGASEVAVDGAGNVYVTGSFDGAATIGGQAVTSQGQRDVFVARFTNGGQLTWVKTVGSTTNDNSVTLALSKSGDRVAIGGVIAGPAVIEETVLAANNADAYVVVLDADGTLQWSLVYGAEFSDGVESVTFDDDGGLFVGGYFTGAISIGSISLSETGGRDVVVAALDPEGVPLWARALEAKDFAAVRGMAASFDGSVIIGGYYAPEIDLGGVTRVSEGGTDIYLGRLLPPKEIP